MNALAQVSSGLFVLPAYGRKYDTAEQALADWKAGKDFQVSWGPYCSIRDLDRLKQTAPSGVYILFKNGAVEV